MDKLVSIVFISAVLVLVAIAAVSAIAVGTVRASLARVENAGYVALTSAEYDNLNGKLDAIKTDAEAAVAAAEAAVVAAQVAAAKVDLFNSAEVYLFPETTNITVTFTAGNTNTWSAWTEIVDSGATTLSSKFAAAAGYVSDIHAFLASDVSDGYNIEIAYGDAKSVLGRTTFWVPADGVIPYMLSIKSRRVPAGETVYYRMQSTGANGATVQVRMRYFYE